MSNRKFDVSQLSDFTKFCQGVAHQRRENAGYAGERHDGGAQELLDNLATFVAGLNGEVPQRLSGVFNEFLKSRDQEFADFLEQKKKMEARYGKID